MLRKIFIIFLLNIFILNIDLSYSQPVLSLDSLIEEARENNPEILVAKRRWEASLTRVPQAKALDAPTLSFSFMKIPKGSIRLDRTMAEDRMLSISQMFPLFGKLSLKEKIAVVESQMFAAEYKNTELEVINKVKNVYYDLFMNYKEIELKEQSLQFLENIAQVAEAKYIVGDIQQEEVLKIHSEIAILSNNILNLEQEQSAIKTLLNTLLNREPESPLEVAQLSEDLSFSYDINNLYRFTLMNQPELLIFSYAIERNKYAKSLAEKKLLPDLMAELGFRGISAGGIGLWDLMLGFTLPFWFWTKQRYQVKEAIYNLEEAQAAYEAMKNKALSETKDLATKIEIAKDKINLYKNNLIPILESSIEASLAGFRSGKGDFMMLLDSERMLIETKMYYYKALVEYNMNLADLERTVGLDLKEVKR